MFTKSYSHELVRFFSVFSRHQAAGINARDSIREYINYTNDLKLKEVLEEILKDMNKGDNIADALSKHPDFCPSYVTEFLKIGIRNSQLDKFVIEIVESLQREEDTKRQLKGQMKGPIAAFFLFVVAFCLLVFVIVPKLSQSFSRLQGFEMPMITQILISVGDFMLHYNWLVALIILALVLAFNVFRVNFPERYDLFKLQIPFLGKVLNLQMQYNFARVFGLCVESGMPVRDALRYTSMAINNIPYQETLKQAARFISNAGLTLPDAIEKADKYKLVNPNFVLMFRATAKTGSLGETMASEAEHYHKDMMQASEEMGEKVGLCLSIPGYCALLILLLALELPIWKAMESATSVVGGGM